MKKNIWGIPVDKTIEQYNATHPDSPFVQIAKGADAPVYRLTIKRKTRNTKQADGERDSCTYIIKVVDIYRQGHEGEFYNRFSYCQHILRKYDQVICPNLKKVCLVLEDMPQGSVITWLADQKKLYMDNEDLQRLVSQILQALTCLHSKSVYHRDIKPDNICYDASTKCYKLIDFSRSMHENPGWMVLGTELYEAPEILDAIKFQRGSTADLDFGACDIFSFGLMLVRLGQGKECLNMLSGQLLSILKNNDNWKDSSSNFQSILASCCTRSPKWPDEINELALECLRLDPKKRPTARELLKNFAEGVGECGERHDLSITKIYPPHLLDKDRECHSKILDELLKKFETKSDQYRVSGGSTSTQPSGGADRDHANAMRSPSNTKLETFGIREETEVSPLQAFLKEYSAQLTGLLEVKSAAKYTKRRFFSIKFREDQPVPVFDPKKYKLPSIEIVGDPQQENYFDNVEGSCICAEENDRLTGIGVASLVINNKDLVYLGQFSKGRPHGYALVFQNPCTKLHGCSVDSQTDEVIIAGENDKCLLDEYLQHLYKDTLITSTKSELSESEASKELFWCPNSKFKLFAGQLSDGKPDLTPCHISYESRVCVDISLTNWTLSGKSYMYLGEGKTINGFLTDGIVDKYSAFKVFSWQLISLRTSEEHLRRCIIEKALSKDEISVLSEDTWHYSAVDWLNYHTATKGTIKLVSIPGMTFEYQGGWEKFLPHGASALLKVQFETEVFNTSTSFVKSLVMISDFFKKHWLSLKSDRPNPISENNTLIADDLFNLNQKTATKPKAKQTIIYYEGGFVHNQLSGFGNVRIEIPTLGWEAKYIGLFNLGYMEGADGKLDLDYRLDGLGCQYSISYKGGFQNSKFHGIGKLISKTPACQMELQAEFDKGFIAFEKPFEIEFKYKNLPSVPYVSKFKGCLETPFIEKPKGASLRSRGTIFYKQGEADYSVYVGDILMCFNKDLSIGDSSFQLKNFYFSTLDNLGISHLQSLFLSFGVYTLQRNGSGVMNYKVFKISCSPATDGAKMIRYEGSWQEDKFHDTSVVDLQNGWRYQGKLNAQGHFHDDQGKLEWDQRFSFKGKFTDGFMTRGTKFFSNSASSRYERYEGEFNMNFMEHGKGTFYGYDGSQTEAFCENGRKKWVYEKIRHFDTWLTYQGNIKEDQFCDKEAILKTPLYEYRGAFEGNMAHGKGSLTIYTDTIKNQPDEIQFYEGSFQNQYAFGTARIVFQNNDSFRGDVYPFSYELPEPPSCVTSSLSLQPADTFRSFADGTEAQHAAPPKSLNDEILQKILQFPPEFRIFFRLRKEINGKGVLRSELTYKEYQTTIVGGTPEGEGRCRGLLFGRPYLYQGSFKNGFMDGKGKLEFTETKDYYFSQEWLQDKPLKGVMYLAAGGERYTGEFEDFFRHGKGILEYSKDDKGGFRKYTGQFYRGKLQGFGKMEFRTGEVFEGTFLNGSQNGPGFKETPQYILKGDGFRSFRLVGEGFLFRFYPNSAFGDLYHGVYTDGKLERAIVFRQTNEFNPRDKELKIPQNYLVKFAGKLDPFTLEITDPEATGEYLAMNMVYQGGVEGFKRNGQGELRFLSGYQLPYLRNCVLQGKFKDDLVKGDCFLRFPMGSNWGSYFGQVCQKFLPKGKGVLYLSGSNRKWVGEFSQGQPSDNGEFHEGSQKPIKKMHSDQLPKHPPQP